LGIVGGQLSVVNVRGQWSVVRGQLSVGYSPETRLTV
jgi:hypothetical protein